MGKIFKQLARHWAACLAVVALLFVQAYCDLSLPDYTSKIVDTGIQQGGIESPLPETVRQSTLDALSLLMSEEDADALQNAYGYYLQDDGVLKLRSDLPDAEQLVTRCAFLFAARRRYFVSHVISVRMTSVGLPVTRLSGFPTVRFPRFFRGALPP